MPKMMPEIFSSPVITRYQEGRPILTKENVPYPAELIFNAGVTKYQGKYVMVFRDDYDCHNGFPEKTHLGLAFSTDGLHWEVQAHPMWNAEMLRTPEIQRIYDPRLTVLEGRCYLCFAMDTAHGLRGGIAVTEDFEKIDILSLSVPDNRNMVLFPERINGRYLRLERPFPVYSRNGVDRFDMWISRSPDLRYWGDSQLLLAVEQVPYANDKVGPGAPPIRTSKGWLTLFHAVHRDSSRGKNGWGECWQKCYFICVALLDLEDPARVIGWSKQPLLAPETIWEADQGYRTNVVFPGGLIAEPDGSVKIYYGASDTVECLAFSSVDELLQLCLF